MRAELTVVMLASTEHPVRYIAMSCSDLRAKTRNTSILFGAGK